MTTAEGAILSHKNVHMSLSVAGVLGDWPRWQDAFVDDTGRRAKRSEVLAHFRELDAQGVKVVPFLGGPCEGWNDQTGCPGHPVADPGNAPTLSP